MFNIPPGISCSPYLQALNGAPIVGAEVHSSSGTAWNGVATDITDYAGKYGVVPNCAWNDPNPISSTWVVSPKVANTMFSPKCGVSVEHDFLLPHPEEAIFSMNDLPQTYDDRYNITLCDPNDELKLNLLGHWIQFGTKYHVRVFLADYAGNPVGLPVYDHVEHNLMGLPTKVDLAGVVDYLRQNVQDLEEVFYVELEVGNCNGWKPIKHDALFRLRDLSGLTLENLKIQPVPNHPPIPINNTSCTVPINTSFSGSEISFASVTGTADQVYLKISQYDLNCQSTGKILNGITLDVNNTSQLSIPIFWYFGASLDPNPDPNYGTPTGSPSNSSTGTNFYLESLLAGVYTNFSYKVEVIVSNPCKQILTSFWIHPTQFKTNKLTGFETFHLVTNPVFDQLNISYSTSESHLIQLVVYDQLGQVVINNTNQKPIKGIGNINIDASFLKQGVYYYSIYSDNRLITTDKFVK